VKASDLRTLSEAELVAKARELRDELFNARVKRATGQLENTAKLGQLRRDVARAETVLAQKRRTST
jgi:large subunit ribosomal protein L29